MAEPQVKQKRVNGVNLAFVEAGKGQTVVFVHGANGDWRTWDSLRSYIAEKYHYVALSRRYHQPNPWPSDGTDYSATTACARLGRLHPRARRGHCPPRRRFLRRHNSDECGASISGFGEKPGAQRAWTNQCRNARG